MGRGRGGGMRRSSPSPPPARRAAPPAPAPRAAAPPAQAPAGGGGPGIMGQMAATAGGVAVGSVIGHGVSNALFGGGGGGSGEVAQAAQVQDQAPQQQAGPGACEYELRRFIECSQQPGQELAQCEQFNMALKDCRMRYGMA